MSRLTADALDGKTVLVTGARGLVGSCLLEKLQHRFPLAMVLAPVRSELDLMEAPAVLEYWRHRRPDVVFHLAAFVRGLGGNLAAGQHAFSANATLNHNVLAACLAYPPQMAFVAGSVAMYPFPFRNFPLVEADACLDEPHSGEYFYAQSKRALVPYLHALRRGSGCKTTLGLFTNLYGPRDRFDDEVGHVVPSLVRRFVEATRADHCDVTVWGSPDTTRDFAFVEDAVEAAFALLGTDSQMCNIASGRETSMAQLVAALQAATGYRGKVRWDGTKPVGIPRRAVDTTQLATLAPDVTFRTLDEGIRTTVSWYQEQGPPAAHPG